MIAGDSITVVIPTLNSSSTIAECLRSVSNQTLRPTETIVVDGNSTDATERIARDYNALFTNVSPPGLLNARRIGTMMAKSAAIALIDSDQVLEPFALEAAVRALQNADMVILEEYSLSPKTWLERLFSADRQRLHRQWTVEADPVDGVLLPRVFRAALLKEVMVGIPDSVANVVVPLDHAIIYYEASKRSDRVGFVQSAVGHHETKALKGFCIKQFRWGVHEAIACNDPVYKRYRDLWLRKMRYRARTPGILVDAATRRSLLLMALKAGPYWAGFSWRRLSHVVGRS